MNIRDAKEEIINTIKVYLERDKEGNYRIPRVRQRPILMIGPPGVGKTQIIEQIAEECQVGLVSYTITHHTRQSAVGLPFIKEEEFEGEKYSVTEYTMSEIIASVYRQMRETGKKEGILFIDEINCVSETLAPTMLQFLQCKRFGNQDVPEGWIIVAAGNPVEYNKSVREFDVVTLDRVRQIDVQADYRVWKEYAREVGIHRAILGYLELYPKNFYRIEADVDGMKYVTARGWEDLSNLLTLYEEKGFKITTDILREYIAHEDVAEDFYAYLDLFHKYREEYPIGDIFAGTVNSQIYERLTRAGFDEKITVVELLVDGLTTLYDQLESAEYLSASLENAFSFVESAFGDEEEMVLFVTEITMIPKLVMFLAEHPSESYLVHSEKLLAQERRREILREMKK
ncbi:AAA family ATPase [Eubacterium xylanophilum]|uniref:AAA family ATPase n=1 Tax=Eubacterium xylanophilum TaxID=39497 RepID=UPI00047C60B8|nr:AAA family ATPase [Eubacterium xylanophilum]MCR5798381.1 AAA family ATPase [Eubacterium sp.]